MTDSLGPLSKSLPAFLPDSRRKTCSLLSFSGDPGPGFVFRNIKMSWVYYRLFSQDPSWVCSSYLLILRTFLLPSRGPGSPLCRPTSLEASLVASAPSIFTASNSPLRLSQMLYLWLRFCHHILLWLLLFCFHFDLSPCGYTEPTWIISLFYF